MPNNISELINLPELKDLELISGSKGILNEVKWVHFIEMSDDIDYIQGDELILCTGIGISNDLEKFTELITGAIEKGAAGLVVNVGKHIYEIPDHIKKISDENDFPVLELPWKSNLSQLTRIICNHIIKNCSQNLSYLDLFKNIISLNNVNYENFLTSISSFGYTSLNSFRVVVVALPDFEKYLSSKNIRDEQRILNIRNALFTSVNSFIWEAKSLPITFQKNDSIILLMVNEMDTAMNLEIFPKAIKEAMKGQLSDIKVNIGIGNIYSKFSDIRKSYLEADKSLKFLKAQDKADEIVFYSSIGAYKLATSIEDADLLFDYYNDTVGKLDKYDLQHDTDFSKIFYVFLKENGASIKASQKLFLHRNTLMYKINKIQEIIERDVTDEEVRLEFYLGYIVKYLNNF